MKAIAALKEDEKLREENFGIAKAVDSLYEVIGEISISSLRFHTLDSKHLFNKFLRAGESYPILYFHLG